MPALRCGERLRKIQMDRGINSRELASLLGTTPQQVHRWRNQDDMTVSSIHRICKALDMPVSKFFDG